MMVPKKRNDSVASKSGPCNCNLWTFFFLFSTSVTVTPSTPCVRVFFAHRLLKFVYIITQPS